MIDDNDHLSDEVWYFGGILGSGVLVSKETLKSPPKDFHPVFLKLSTY